ncbi:MAG: M56 family metallopeptidase [Polyangiaceae bacterium]|nr:M56 family metallopeptidase [Polyangiaceae bacterium]
MSTVSLWSVIVLLFAAGSMAGAIVVTSLETMLRRSLRSFAPAARVRWLTTLVAMPYATGLLAVVVAFGPCLHHLAFGLEDGCLAHGRPNFFFCLRTPMHDVPMAWAAAGLLLAFALGRAVASTVRLVRAHRACCMLRRVGRWDASRSVWLVPGSVAMVAGLPSPHIFLGEVLVQHFSQRVLDAVLAHERAHAARRDLATKLIARVAASCLPPRTRAELLSELDLAMEQACDAIAAADTRDPLLVARSLLELASIDDRPHAWAATFASSEHLEARVRALCEPRWRSSRSAFAAASTLVTGLLLTCLVFDLKIHEATETIFATLLVG